MEEKVSEKQNVKVNKKTKIVLIILVVSVCIIIFFSTIFAIFSSMNSKVISGISLQGINVSGLKKEEIESRFKEMIDNLEQKEIVLKYGEVENNIKTAI